MMSRCPWPCTSPEVNSGGPDRTREEVSGRKHCAGGNCGPERRHREEVEEEHGASVEDHRTVHGGGVGKAVGTEVEEAAVVAVVVIMSAMGKRWRWRESWHGWRWKGDVMHLQEREEYN